MNNASNCSSLLHCSARLKTKWKVKNITVWYQILLVMLHCSSICQSYEYTVDLFLLKMLTYRSNNLSQKQNKNSTEIQNLWQVCQKMLLNFAQYLNNASTYFEINSRISKSSNTFAQITARVWNNLKLTICTRRLLLVPYTKKKDIFILYSYLV